MSQYNIIASTTESTVVAEYTPGTRRSDSYQSEAQLEKEFTPTALHLHDGGR